MRMRETGRKGENARTRWRKRENAMAKKRRILRVFVIDFSLFRHRIFVFSPSRSRILAFSPSHFRILEFSSSHFRFFAFSPYMKNAKIDLAETGHRSKTIMLSESCWLCILSLIFSWSFVHLFATLCFNSKIVVTSGIFPNFQAMCTFIGRVLKCQSLHDGQFAVNHQKIIF